MPALRHLVYVNPDYLGGSPDGSMAKPYTTIQAAINAILPFADAKSWWGVLISPGDYDEDIAFDGTGKHIALLGLGPWGLGTFTGPAGAPTGTPRSINWTVSGGNVDSTQHSLMIGAYQGPNMGLSTHISQQSVTRISGGINVIDNVMSGGSTKTLIVQAQVYGYNGANPPVRSIDCTLGAAPSIGGCNLWLFNSRFATDVHAPPTLGGAGGLLQWADTCRFDGALTIGRYSRVQNSTIQGAVTVSSATVDTRPSGFINSYFAPGSSYSGGAAPLRLDGNTNYWVKTNAIAIAPSKTIEDDTTP